MKNQKGITLIALIITIIVMLILAGVAISALVSDDGVLTKAEDAKLLHGIAVIQEALELAVVDDKIGIDTGLEELQNITLEKMQNGEIGPITNYTDYRDLMKILIMEAPCFSYGDLYDIESGKLIGEELLWIPTEFITGDPILVEELDEMFEIQPLNIATELGKIGTTEIWAEGDGLDAYGAKKDMFFIDKEYNIYYMAENGDVVTSEGIIKQENVSSIDPDLLEGTAGPAFNGIKEAAIDFTGDESYAKLIAENDLNIESTINTFFGGGYMTVDIKDKSTDAVIKDNIALLMYNTDYTTQNALMTGKIWYGMDYEEDTGKYVMYKYDRNTNKIYDKDGNVLASNVTHTSANACTKDINNDGNLYNGYGYIERFDGRDAIIATIPDKEIVDMETDLAGFNFDVKYWFMSSENTTVKELILPNSIETLEMLAVGRLETESTYDFATMPNLTSIKLSENIKKIYATTFHDLTYLEEVIMPDNIESIASNAFEELTQNIKVYFKDGKAVSGSPWGANKVEICTK